RLDEIALLERRGGVVAAVASEARTLRARAWGRREKASFVKNADVLAAFLASDDGVERIPVFVASLAPGLEDPAAEVLVSVDARRPQALPATLARELAP